MKAQLLFKFKTEDGRFLDIKEVKGCKDSAGKDTEIEDEP